jgi:hypothetical protein
MVLNTVLWFDVPVDQASVLEMFGERVVWRFCRFWQRERRVRGPAGHRGLRLTARHIPRSCPETVRTA